MEQLQQIALHARHKYLAFRVAKPHIIFNQLRAFVRHHQPGIEDAFEGSAHVSHRLHCGADDGVHHQFLGFSAKYRSRGVSAHSASVWACIPIANTLVVLRGCQWQRGLAVAQAEEADLGPVQIFFNDDFSTSGTERAVETGINGAKRVIQRHRYGDAFACGQTVCLDHDWRALFFDIGPGFGCIGKASVSGCRDIIARANVLGETFGTFKLRGNLGGAEHRDACGVQTVRQTIHEWCFRSNDHQFDCVEMAEGNDGLMVLDVDDGICAE